LKRFHVHTHVRDLSQSITFYTQLFGVLPTRVESDYAKWMLEDPRINFAISARGGAPGVDHLGIQTDSAEELVELKARARAADLSLLDEGETTCCYARSEKHWISDPQGMAWEHFHTLGDIPVFNESGSAQPSPSACCAPGVTSPDAAQASTTEAAAHCAPTPRGKAVGIAVKPSTSCC
jgi:Glyoxalase/Bleomycin resistance protein/Dioxygenase superfamily